MWELTSHVPPLPEAEQKQKNLNDMGMAVKAVSAQGVTSLLDAAANESTIEAFSGLAKNGELTVRANLAPNFGPERLEDPQKIITEVKGLAPKMDGHCCPYYGDKGPSVRPSVQGPESRHP